MAQRRIFSMKVIDTDLFLEMPSTSQLLYFHLAMRADDDGFVCSPKKILKSIGCGEDDFKVLIAKQFIIPFESGICVIRHWFIHNLIRKDRYYETEYKAEKQLLVIENNKYEKLGCQNVIPNANQMAPQLNLTEPNSTKLNLKKHMCDKPHEPLPKKEFNYSEEFENTWAYYPKRQGANSKVTAYKHWRTRIAEGVKNEDLLIATKNYQVLMSNCGSTGTAYVMQAQRFYGANKEYEQFINIKPEELIHAEHSRNNQTGSYKSDKQRREEVNESINRITADIDLSNAF